MTNTPDGDKPLPPGDLEIKDAQLIFSAVWDDLQERHSRDNLRFPRDFIWLGGAPGAGKGTNTPFIAETRGITAPPIVVSDLLTSPQAVAIKNAVYVADKFAQLGLGQELAAAIGDHAFLWEASAASPVSSSAGAVS